MDTGKHVRASDLDCESVYDAAQKKWTDGVGEMYVASRNRQRSAFEEPGPSSARERRNKGWALKSAKRTNKMEEEVKAFLVQKFNQGVAGRQKADPIHVAREIKSIRDSSGKLQFKPDEWRTAQQISNFFARMSALQRQRQADEIESQEEEQELLGKLSSLKLAQLREVCRALSLQTNGSNSRKRTFTEPLDAYAKLCSCRK